MILKNKKLFCYISFLLESFSEFGKIWYSLSFLLIIYCWGGYYHNNRDQKFIEEGCEICFAESSNSIEDIIILLEEPNDTVNSYNKHSIKDNNIKKTKLKTKPKLIEESFKIKKGKNIFASLQEDFNKRQINEIINIVSKKIDLKRLQPKQDFYVSYIDNNGQLDIISLELFPSIDCSLKIIKQSNGKYICQTKRYNLKYEYIKVKGKITKNLYKSILLSGINKVVASEIVKAFQYDANLQSDLRYNDSFCVLYKVVINPVTGEKESRGIVFASLNIKNVQYSLYRFCKNGSSNYVFYNPLGESGQKNFMKTPINGARLSSRFGRRHHPIHGYTKMHRGVDFSAPIGTPIFAASDGVIEKICYNGGYGKYIVIRHGNNYHTLYAHMSKFFPSIRVGQVVKQGQKIGFVGRTGITSGAHLHFEILKNRVHIDPCSVKQLSKKKLYGKDLIEFYKFVKQTNILLSKAKTKQ